MRPRPVAQPRLPWHWILAAAALLAAATGAWTLWGRMPIVRQLPGPALEFFQLRELAEAGDPKALRHRQVFLQGRFTGQVFVIAGDMAGRSGFYVMAPFTEKRKSFVPGAETGLNLMVLLGWVRADQRAAAQSHRPARHDVLLEGRLAIPSPEVAAKAREASVPLLPLVLLQEPGSEWRDEDIRQDFFQRRWPQLYPQDRNIAPKGWGLLALAAVLAAFAAWTRPRPFAPQR